MKLYDISMPIHSNMTVYKNRNENKPFIEVTSEYAEKGVNQSRISMDIHTGTHIDAPFHMIDGGKTIESIDIENLIGKAVVIDLTDVEDGVTASDLKKHPIKYGDFILMKTKNSFKEEFDFEFVYLTEEGAVYLRDKGIRGVGIDALGIERSQSGHKTHKILLGSQIIILEGLRLPEIEPGEYMMYALPLKIIGSDGAPARVVLGEI